MLGIERQYTPNQPKELRFQPQGCTLKCRCHQRDRQQPQRCPCRITRLQLPFPSRPRAFVLYYYTKPPSVHHAMTGGPAVPDVDWWDKSGPATLEHAAVLAHGTGRPPAPNRGPDGKPLYAVPDAFGPTSTMHDVHSLGELHGETGGMLPPPETLGRALQPDIPELVP